MNNVLVFPCGSEIGLEVNRALADSLHFSVFGASSTDDHGKYAYRQYIPGLPFIDAPNFIGEINKIVEQYQIDFIIPAHDAAVLRMAECQAEIKAEVVGSCLETCRICRSKSKTYELFEKLIPTPKLYRETAAIDFPAFLKPDVGQGSKGAYKVNTGEEAAFYCKQDPTVLVMEFLPGREFTIDCFTDRKRSLLFAAGRERSRIANGISVHSQPAQDERFGKMAELINKTLLFRGAWFFQVKERSDGELVLMEIAPRVAGTMALFRADGVNFVQLSLFDRMGLNVSVLSNQLDLEIDRALFSRFSINRAYSCVYVDFDDTIIVNQLVNANLMKFLYQSRNTKKKIILLTKHRQNIEASLDRYAISRALFDEIIVVDATKQKSDYIYNLDSVFIDDSFAERKAVLDQCRIPVFALDAVEALF